MATFSNRESLAALGWESFSTPFPKVIAESGGGERWAITRLWSTASEFTVRSLAPTMHCAVLGVDGVGTVETAAGCVQLGPGQMVLLRGDAATWRASSDGVWVRYFWQLESAALRQPALRNLEDRALSLSQCYRQLLETASGIGVTCSSRQKSGSPFVVEVLDYLLAAAAWEAAGSLTASADDKERTYRNALLIIDQEHGDPLFAPAAIAARLHISMPTLCRAFQSAATSPALEIERRRTVAAQSLLAQTRSRDAETMKWIVGAAGFTTVRRMRAALQRQAEWLDRRSFSEAKPDITGESFSLSGAP